MNKDVIYIEPEDDITDIIGKVENSKEKIVALVPPKKAGVLRSIVNIKLIAKTGTGTGKKVVLVTTDPAILKLAAVTKLPVTKDLQSAPAVPKIEAEGSEELITKEELVEKIAENGAENVVAEELEQEDEEKSEDEKKEEKDAKDDTDDKEQKDKKDKKKKKEKAVGTSKIPFIRWIQEHKKLCIGGGIGFVVLVLVLVWAFAIAPAATVTVKVRTTKNNFSENVTFTETLADENASEGKFYLEQKKIETKAETKFEATGQKNVGEKASGTVTIWAHFPITGGAASTTVAAGEIFSLGELSYAADDSVSISWDGDITELKTNCANGTNNDSLKNYGCLIYGNVAVTAIEPGTKYNIAASNTGWKAPSRVNGAYSSEDMSGGTDKMITIVKQSDIDAALEKLETGDNSANKERLFDEISETSFIIEPSYRQTVGDPVSTPKVGEEVKDGAKATLSVTTTDSVYYIDNTKVEEFIKEKAKLAENYKIYSMENPFVENFIKTDNGYTGKLKTSYVSGPRVTENDIVEIVKGKGIGTAKHDLSDIDGIKEINITPSYFWVSSVPNDPEKITVIIEIPEDE